MEPAIRLYRLRAVVQIKVSETFEEVDDDVFLIHVNHPLERIHYSAFLLITPSQSERVLNTIYDVMSRDHQLCDESFTVAEAAVAKVNWDEAGQHFAEFMKSMTLHLRKEEEVLFPAFEAETGQSGGPTQVMRMEHEQMRSLFKEMEAAVARRDSDEYLGLSETLLTLMQQHNIKEEQVLYPMMDQALAGRREQLLARLAQIE